MTRFSFLAIAISCALLLGPHTAFAFQPRVTLSSNGGTTADGRRRLAPRVAPVIEATAAPGEPEPFTKARLHNQPLFRSAAILSALAVAGTKSPIPASASATLHLLSYGTFLGTVIYTTFIAGLTMFKNLPRRTFGQLQSKLFPKYFSLCSISVVVQLVTLPRLTGIATKASTKALGMCLAMTLLNQFLLEPKSTQIMFDRYQLEDDGVSKQSPEYKSLASSFGKLHGMSSLTNLIGLVAAVVHGVFLSAALVV